MSYDDMPQKQARIEALREEKGRLQKVRQTIAFYEANAASGKVKKGSSPTNGTADSAGRGGEIQYQRCRKSS